MARMREIEAMMDFMVAMTILFLSVLEEIVVELVKFYVDVKDVEDMELCDCKKHRDFPSLYMQEKSIVGLRHRSIRAFSQHAKSTSRAIAATRGLILRHRNSRYGRTFEIKRQATKRQRCRSLSAMQNDSSGV